ncbi:hypothetical protein Lser_V15G34059 [Lactuca serriola]
MQIFPEAIGALYGTLVHVVVPVDQQTHYRRRGKGECYQNVIGICNFDMIFTFVWAGWEGMAHDSKVLKEVAFNPTSGFPFPPPDKYYLCDAAYTNTRGFMAPYRNTRKYNIEVELFTNFEQNTMVTPNVGGGGNEGQNIEGIEWGSEAVDYMTTLRDQIANQLLSNGSR